MQPVTSSWKHAKNDDTFGLVCWYNWTLWVTYVLTCVLDYYYSTTTQLYWFSNPARAIFTTKMHWMNMTFHVWSWSTQIDGILKTLLLGPSSYWCLLLSFNAYARVTPESYTYIPSWPNRLYILSGLYIVPIIIYAPCAAIGQRQRCKRFGTIESSFAVKIQTWSRCTEYYTPSCPAKYRPERFGFSCQHSVSDGKRLNVDKRSSINIANPCVTTKYLAEWSSKLGGITPVFLTRRRIAFVWTNVHHKYHQHLYQCT